MIKGLDVFRTHFARFTEHYVLIGGAAADIVMNDAGLPFRATKDLDIVLCIEVLDSSFAKAFWAFIKEADYQCQQRSTGKKVFYRFNQPKNTQYPYMLELFSRAPETMVLGNDQHLTPIPIADDVSSLSAILLDNDYYQFLHQNKIIIEGVSIINEACLIPLKAKAWLDLSQRENAGEKIDSKSIKKHKNDIFRLFQIISPNITINLPTSIKNDMTEYLIAISKDNIKLKNFGLDNLSVEKVVHSLKSIYDIN